jgi:hypothetical protein
MATWIKPTEENLKHEFKVEIELKGNKFFKSYEQIKAQADKAEVVELTKDLDRKIAYRSHTSSKQQLINLIRGYRSYPQYRNEQTIENLFERIANDETMTMPIVLKFKDGSMRVLGGNTRLDVAFQLGKTPKVLMIESL